MPRRILVVDNSEFARVSLCEALRNKNYLAESVSSGRECLEKLSREEFDLAIIDYQMPDMNGLEVLQEINDKNYKVAVIIMTGKGSEEVAVQAMKLGALNYLHKTENYSDIVLDVIREDFDLYKVAESRRSLYIRRKADPAQESQEIKPKTKDKILVVDDSRFIREILADTLRLNNYEVDTAASGAECLEKIDKEDIDLAIIDYVMPGMNGLEVLKEISNKKYPTPVIMLTGKGSEEVAVQAMKLGALDYVIKAIGHMQSLPDIIRDNLYMFRTALKGQIEQGIVSVKERILITDDSLTVREKLNELLTSRNYEVEMATSGSECLAKLAEKKYDLLLLDFIMPEMNGLEVLREINSRKFDLPCIMMTGKGNEEIAVEAMKLGALDYVIKTVGYLESFPDLVPRNLRMYRINKEKALLEKKLVRKNKDLESRIMQLRALNEISKHIGESLDIDKTLTVIISQIASLINCSRITIMLLDPERAYLTIKAAKGFPEEGATKVKVKVGEGISGYVASQGEPVFITNIEEDPRFKKMNSEQYYAKSLISVPLKIRDEVIGVINVNNKLDNELFTIDDCDILMTISYNAAIAIENSRRYEEAKSLAIKDALTGLYNQAYFWRVFEMETERSKRYKNPLCLVIIDVDNFKHVNDTYGHQKGDMVLAEVGRVLSQSIRKVDILFRYGGDEFIVLLTETDLEGARMISERLRAKIEDHCFSTPAINDLKITFSLGCSQYKKDMTQKGFFENTDKVLYEAKQKGKNCSCFCP
jgi:diguanylate cyclase (GGDEF)-like protein